MCDACTMASATKCPRCEFTDLCEFTVLLIDEASFYRDGVFNQVTADLFA